MSVARPGVIAFGLFFVIMLVYRWYKQKKFSWIEFGFAALSGVLGVLWIVIAWITTGRFDAYLKTEFAWRAGFVDAAGVIPFTGWFESGRFFIGDWLGLVVVVCAIIFFVCLMFFPSIVATGVEMRAWLGAYLFYLFAIFFPQSSTPRILMPAITMMVAFGIATSKFGRFGKAAVVALSLLGQVVWLLICWKYTAPDYTPP
jgi:hypothetical protein